MVLPRVALARGSGSGCVPGLRPGTSACWMKMARMINRYSTQSSHVGLS